FTWRSELRKLGGAVEPSRDLWPGIAARLPARAARRRFPRLAAAIAAGVAVVCIGGVVGWRVLEQRAAAEADAALPRAALDWAQPANPTLAAAAQDLDGASAKLQQALEERPDAVFLVGLLNRTNGQRMRLMQAPYAG